ncbi:MAG: ACP S-malonyltransferase [Gammaproteobacteria bacterium]
MSQTKALLFPGQGSQFTGMLSQLGLSNSSILNKYQTVIDSFSNLIGMDLISLIEDANLEDKLNQTQYTQPAILFTSYVVYRELIYSKYDFSYFAGHSLGEYSALVCANSIEILDGLNLVYQRGQLMTTADKGAMSAIIGINTETIDEVCESITASGFPVQSANKNSPLQTVISGSLEGIEKAELRLKELGAKRAIRLNVSVASHSQIMKSITSKFSEALDNLEISMPEIPILQNVSASVPKDLEELKTNLINQLYSPVNWVDTMNKLSTFDQVIECGPGKVLTGLGKQNNLSVCDILSLEG